MKNFFRIAFVAIVLIGLYSLATGAAEFADQVNDVQGERMEEALNG